MKIKQTEVMGGSQCSTRKKLWLKELYENFLFVFIENRFFSQTVHPDHSFLSLHSSHTPTS